LETEDALLTGELFKLYNDLPVHLALGAQRRVEDTQSVVDPFSLTGDLSFTGPVPNYAIERTTYAVFAELLFPIASTLDLDLAARTERIVDGTTATNPKLGLNWRPLKTLSFSASIGSSERAPGLLTLLQTSGLGGVADDPITHSAQYGFAVLYLPSKGLSPEKSTNWNLGTTFSPMTPVGQFDLTADIWSIDFKDLITTENANTLDLTDPTSPAIQRSPTGQIQLITLPGYFNANEEKLRGVDFDFRENGTDLSRSAVRMYG
jgi:iron complex outermembrane recepter protein